MCFFTHKKKAVACTKRVIMLEAGQNNQKRGASALAQFEIRYVGDKGE
jgi:hypothetical protein